MHLKQFEVELFYKLWHDLVWEINEKHKIIPPFKKMEYGGVFTMPKTSFGILRNTIWQNPEWIDAYLEEQANKLTGHEYNIIQNWRNHHIFGKFILMRHLKHYSVFMEASLKEDAKIYGVLGISDSFKDMFHGETHLPLDTVLLPFGNRIIYDGIFKHSNKPLDPILRAHYNTNYKKVKETFGITTDLTR